IAIEGHKCRAMQLYAACVSEIAVSGCGDRSEGHAVKAIRKGDDGRPSRDVSSNLHRSLDSVRSGRSGELHLVPHASWLEDQGVEGLNKGLLCLRHEVEAVDYLVRLYVFEQLLLDSWIVMAIVEGTSTCQEINILTSFFVLDGGSFGFGEYHREA